MVKIIKKVEAPIPIGSKSINRYSPTLITIKPESSRVEKLSKRELLSKKWVTSKSPIARQASIKAKKRKGTNIEIRPAAKKFQLVVAAVINNSGSDRSKNWRKATKFMRIFLK